MGILNVYNAGRGMTLTELNNYFQQLSAKVIIVGDFNAHHPLWDNRRGPCANGQNIVAAIAQGDLLLLIPQNMPTYLDSRTGRPSTLDLCFILSSLFPSSSIALAADLGSDHCSVKITVQVIP